MPREFLSGKKFADGQEVRASSNDQRDNKRRFTRAAEVARADRQRHKQDGAKCGQPTRACESHRSSTPTACSHSLSHAAVRGAFWGANLSSRASKIKSFATSMS